MKISNMTIVILLLLAGMFLASAQYDLETDTGYACWQCPVCGYVVSLTPAEAASINPYTLCPSCYSAYAGNFIPVSCQSTPGYDTYGYTSQGYNQQEMEDENVMNLQEGGNYASSGKGKILMVLSPQEYQEEELNVPREYFQSRGYSVILASKGVKTATGMSGESVDVDLDLKSVKLSDYVAVIFVGGEGIYSLKLNEDPDYQALAKSASAQKKLVGAICLGPWILADAGLLKGKMATASETDHIKSKGAIVSDEAVVRDGNIITGNGPYASQKFAEAVIAALETSGSAGSIGGGSDQTDFPQMDGSLTRNSGSAASDTRAASSESSQAAKWRCTVCGYIYDPAENDGVPFEKLPSSWKCPCGAPKSKFVKV